MRALEDDLDAPRAIRTLEREARRAPAAAKPSLRFIARRVLGIA